MFNKDSAQDHVPNLVSQKEKEKKKQSAKCLPIGKFSCMDTPTIVSSLSFSGSQLSACIA